MSFSVGQMDREAWMRRENVTRSGDRYYKAVYAADGGTAWREAQVPPEIVAAEGAASGKVSEMIFNALEAESQALVKKVAFNPKAFTYYSWAKRKATKPDKDFGDFVNYCINLTMTKILGTRIGVVVNTDDTLMAMLRAKW